MSSNFLWRNSPRNLCREVFPMENDFQPPCISEMGYWNTLRIKVRGALLSMFLTLNTGSLSVPSIEPTSVLFWNVTSNFECKSIWPCWTRYECWPKRKFEVRYIPWNSGQLPWFVNRNIIEIHVCCFVCWWTFMCLRFRLTKTQHTHQCLKIKKKRQVLWTHICESSLSAQTKK